MTKVQLVTLSYAVFSLEKFLTVLHCIKKNV